MNDWLRNQAAAGRPFLGLTTSFPPLTRPTGPLVPPVCSLALIPVSQAGLLPAALQPLMLLPDSELAELYEECEVRGWIEV